MKCILYPDSLQWPELAARPAEDDKQLEALVAGIFSAVQDRGDAACREFTQQYDRVSLQNFCTSEEEFAEAERLVPSALRDAIAVAAGAIRAFHEAQRELPSVVETAPGVRCWRRSVPVENVGLYIPGGTAPLFSTVLMLAIPAALAGCRNVVMCTPPDTAGRVHPAVLYASRFAGVHAVFKIGGAQAIAAMAVGTKSIPVVQKIFGPGNQYVTAAKRYAASLHTAIDLPAGPSELLVVADETAVPAFVAADLLSQAEHGADSQVLLVVWQQDVAEQIIAELQRQAETLPRRAIVQRALEHSRAIVLHNRREVAAFVNRYAPEHLSLAVDNSDYFVEHIVNAGSVFIGHYTPEAAGDYASGTNHTLPTGGWAAATGGVSLDSFVKKITYQNISREGLQYIGPTVEIMARAELLEAHRRAVSVRLAALAQEAENA